MHDAALRGLMRKLSVEVPDEGAGPLPCPLTPTHQLH